MAAVLHTNRAYTDQSCVTGRCAVRVKRLTAGDGTVYYVCGPTQSRPPPPQPCKIYRLDRYRRTPHQPTGSRVLNRLFRLFHF